MLQRTVWSTSKRIFWKKIVHFTIYSICAPYSPIKSFVSLTFVKNKNANVYEKHILIIELADITLLRYTGKPHQGNAGKDRQGSIGQVRSRTTQKPK